MFDAHCHLHDRRLAGQTDRLVARAAEAGVTGMLLAGVDEPGWRDERALAARHPSLALSFGLHPRIIAERHARSGDEEAARLCEGSLEELARELAAGGAVCVGEIGLDLVGDRRPSLALQERLFAAQLELARQVDLPVALHVLGAHERALSIVRRVGLPGRGGMVHSFSGSAELAHQWLTLGLHLSFAGAPSLPQSTRLRRAIAVVPDARLLVETDAPDQTPLALRPQLNEPAFLVANARALAQIRGQSAAEVAACTEANARQLFGLPRSP